MTGAGCANANPSAGAQKRRGAGRGQRGGQQAVEKRAGRAVPGCEFARRIQCASAQRDFKHAEQIQRHERDEHGEADDENRAAELHSPAGVMAGGLDADDDAGQREKGNEHAERVNQAEMADAARFAARLADEAEDFQRDDWQHAWHDVQNQSADESVEQHQR